MSEEQRAARQKINEADDLLRNMDTTMEIVTIGIENMANGDKVTEMIGHFRNTLQDARSLLDEAYSAMQQTMMTA